MSTIINSIPHAAYPLGLGLLTTSSMFFGNIGLSLTGPMPIIKGKLGEIGLNGKQKLRIWQAFFDEAAVSTILFPTSDTDYVGLRLTVSEIHSRGGVRSLRSAPSGHSPPPYGESQDLVCHLCRPLPLHPSLYWPGCPAHNKGPQDA